MENNTMPSVVKMWIGALLATLISTFVEANAVPPMLPKPTAGINDKVSWRVPRKLRKVERSARVARREPVTNEENDGSNEETGQFELRMTAFAAASETLQSLGLLAEGKLVSEPELLKSQDVWDTALDTASRLGAVSVLSRAPGLRSFDKRKADISIWGPDAEATDPVTGKTAAMRIAHTWIATPTLIDNKRLQLDLKYRMGYSEVIPELSVSDIADGGGHGHGIETSVVVPFDKPTIVGRLTFHCRENPKESDKMVETNLILVVTAHRITEKDLGKVSR